MAPLRKGNTWKYMEIRSFFLEKTSSINYGMSSWIILVFVCSGYATWQVPEALGCGEHRIFMDSLLA